jgi:hypothetical protein
MLVQSPFQTARALAVVEEPEGRFRYDWVGGHRQRFWPLCGGDPQAADAAPRRVFPAHAGPPARVVAGARCTL